MKFINSYNFNVYDYFMIMILYADYVKHHG